MTNRLDLPLRYREQLEALLCEHVPGIEVWAYGSRVNARNHDGSDLDLVLRGPDLEPLGYEYLELVEALEQSNIPILVQAHDWARLPESFHREIERDYVVVQKADHQTAMEVWRKVALVDVVNLQLSSVDKKSKPGEQPVQLCNYMDVYANNFIRRDMDFMAATATDREVLNCSLLAGDVIITKDSEKHDDIGVPAFVREDIPDLVCGYHLAILRPNTSTTDGAYLFYALSAEDAQRQFHSYANGITRFGLRKADIGLVEIPLPPLPEQRAIAGILGALDDKIELNRRMNETLEQMARALFQSWFVDFDPVRAKMAGREPDLPPELWALFPDRLVDSELGEIPEGWAVRTLGDMVKIFDKDRIPLNGRQRSQRQGPYPYYGAAGIMDHVDGYLFDGTHVLIGEDGTVVNDDGGPVVQYVWGQFWVNNHAHVLKGNSGITEETLYFMLRQIDVRPFVTGAVQPKLNQRNLNSIPVCVADRRIYQAFHDWVHPLFAAFRTKATETLILSAKRDTLLPWLVSGELRMVETSIA